ncbi:MAG: DUF3299 domain-containing protein, partial [Asticcacaulis sp.]
MFEHPTRLSRRKALQKLGAAALALPMALPLAAFRLEDMPLDLKAERKAQMSLPKSTDPLWALLSRCPVRQDPKTGLYSLTLTPAVRALAGKKQRVSGFTLPLDGQDRTRHFLIGRLTPVCFYHPPGEPNEVIEVLARKAVTWTSKPQAVEGTFTLVNDREMGVFFRLTDA